MFFLRIRCNNCPKSVRTEEFQAKYPNADLSKLTQQEREGVERYYLNSESLAQIAADWGKSREWVRQVLARALQR
ncbi:hypothetical protein NIES2101_34715 [Calothrix sp. HK-06]|nr:hypothetical protein NIES2101_34715 [Calothrix sp. HK-06]